MAPDPKKREAVHVCGFSQEDIDAADPVEIEDIEEDE